MRPILFLLPLSISLALPLGACGDKDDTGPDTTEGDTDTDSDADSDTDTDADTDADADADTDADADPDMPVIESADAYCYETGEGDTWEQWMAICEVSDPQGADTIVAFDMDDNIVDVADGGSAVTTEYLVCAKGTCSASFAASTYGMDCASASNYSFTFTVVDEDGNVSSPAVASGRPK